MLFIVDSLLDHAEVDRSVVAGFRRPLQSAGHPSDRCPSVLLCLLLFRSNTPLGLRKYRGEHRLQTILLCAGGRLLYRSDVALAARVTVDCADGF